MIVLRVTGAVRGWHRGSWAVERGLEEGQVRVVAEASVPLPAGRLAQQAELDTGLLSGEGWPASLPPAGELDWVAVFTTDFERETWLLSYQGAEIEVALDQGLIRCDCPEGGHLEDEILELELELKSGEAEALLALAEDLGQTLSLQPFDLSKAQRGYQ
ncbi:MAG: CYTH domain-containing protein, partial [Chloroflexia bacterium]|nr:CYTH domain-containing protein [Chloroflexia bacterium]